MTVPPSVATTGDSLAGDTGRGPNNRLMNRRLLTVFVSSFGSMMSFYLLLSVVPKYATSRGASGIGAGLATGALMLSTVIAEVATPRFVARFGYRVAFAAGLLLLGAPALALGSATSVSAILAICLLRGVGVAIVVVVGGALVASLVPAERRGEGLGLYGIVVGVPAVLGLPIGVWLADHAGYSVVFVLGALVALAGLLVAPVLPGRIIRSEQSIGLVAALRIAGMLRPSILFAATTIAAGAIVTFLPLAVSHASGTLAAFGLLVQAGAATLTRWWAGRHGDRHGSARLLEPAVFVSALGMIALVYVSNSIVVIAGMALFGAGFGVAQNASLAMMFERTPPSGYDTVSALWNLAYDAGLGLGAAGFGVIAARIGYPLTFVLVGVVMLVIIARRFGARESRRS